MNRVSIGSDNGLSPIRHQAIIWTNTSSLSIGSLATNFSRFLVKNQTFSFKKMRLKMSSAKWRPFCPGECELRALWRWRSCGWRRCWYTVKPVYNDHLMGYFSAFWSSSRWPLGHLDELQKAEIVSKSKLIPPVPIKTHYWINQR